MAARLPVSQLISDKITKECDQKQSREDWRKAKELDEARKAGTAPALQDETGKDINPHIPQYISSAPWYYNTTGPTLKHQRPQKNQEQQSLIGSQIESFKTKTIVSAKFRKGACENCGAMSHKKKDCLERPRKVGAKYSQSNMAQDEFIPSRQELDYDSKRDRWTGYDSAMHKDIVLEFQKVEEAKRLLKAEKLKEDPNISDDDDDKYADNIDMPGTKVDSKQGNKITVRNLRIREDTAKYLRNLDPNSAFYDPKTRSMRENPNPQKDPEESDFAGENFVRFSGDTQEHATAQLFAWEAHSKGVDVHVLAEPTKLELLQKEYDKKKQEIKSDVRSSILEKYGGDEHLIKPLGLSQTEHYVEYSRYGKIIKGHEKKIARSRYIEDEKINNHTSVFGSFWKTGRWGYKCCKNLIKNSYCVPISTLNSLESTSITTDKDTDPISNSGTENTKLALLSEQNKKQRENILKRMDKKRKYFSNHESAVPTEEEMEAYSKKRLREDDPMAHCSKNL